MKIWSFWAILLFLSSIGLVVAQDEEAKNDGDLESKRHIEVRVELNNDSELEGIVIDGRFYEKYDDKKNRWKAMPSRKGSGLRLWHVEKAEGYIYLSYETDIRRIEEIGKKSQRELDELRDEIKRTKEAEQAKDREKQLAEMEKSETKGEEKTSTSGGNKEELSPEQIRKYEEILQKFPEESFSLSKTVSAIKMRMASGILLGKDSKDFLMEYEFWRQAVKWKKKESPLKEVTEDQVIEAQKLLAKFPPESFSIPEKLQGFVKSSSAGVPLLSIDEEWLSSLDTWLDAQLVVKLGEKMAEAKGTEKTSKPE